MKARLKAQLTTEAAPEPPLPKWLRRWQMGGVVATVAWAVVYLALWALGNPLPQFGFLWLSVGGLAAGAVGSSMGVGAVWRLRREETLTVAPLLLWLAVAALWLPFAAACLFFGAVGVVEWFWAVL